MTFPENLPPQLSGSEIDQYWMQHAFAEAERAQSLGEVPIGAVVIFDNQMVGAGFNQSIKNQDPTAHAEIVAIREAAQSLNNHRLLDCTLYVTLEPCAMCVGAIVHARLQRLVFAAWDPKAGAVRSAFSLLDDPHLNHRVQWSEGIMHQKCQHLLQHFFQQRR